MIDTLDELLAAAARHGLHLVPEREELDGSGLDFLALHARDEAGTRWIVRTPRRDDVYEASRVEARALALVAPRLPVAVPGWRVHDRDVIAYPRLGGTPAVSYDAASGATTWYVVGPEQVPDAFLDTFARALAALQAIAPDDAIAAGLPATTLAEDRATLARQADETRAVLAPPDHLWARWQRWLADDATWPEHVALVHGDLHPGHLLLDDAGRVTGILDWTEAKVADPSIDLAMFGGCFGRAALEALVPRAAALGLRTWPRLVDHAMERWAAFPILGAAWALRTGNETALAFARAQVAAS